MCDIDNIFHLYLENATNQKSMSRKDVDGMGNTSYRLANGQLHRDDGPAIERSSGLKVWWHHGKKHRIDGPAIEYGDGHKEWWLHGELHREDGPAIEYADGNKEWHLNGKRFRNANTWARSVLKLHNKPATADDAQRLLRVVLTKDDLI